MYGQMTAGSWIYIGSQGIVQGTFETFARGRAGLRRRSRRAARRHRGPRRDGRRAAARGDDERRRRRSWPRSTRSGSKSACKTRYLDEQETDLDRAIDRALAAKAAQARRLDRRRGQCRRPARAAARPRRRPGPRHRPDLRARRAHGYVPRGRLARRARAAARGRPEALHRARLRDDGRPRARPPRAPAPRIGRLRLRQQPPRPGAEGRGRRRLRRSAASCPSTSARSSARARGRFAGPRSPATRRTSATTDRALLELFPQDAGARAGGSTLARGAHRVPGPAGADLLARVRRAAPRGPALQRAGSHGAGARADRHRPRPSRRRARWPRPTARPKACATARTRSRDWPILNALHQHGGRRDLGLGPPRRRRRHRVLDPRRHGRRRRRHRGGAPAARAGPEERSRHRRDAPRRRGLSGGDRGGARAGSGPALPALTRGDSTVKRSSISAALAAVVAALAWLDGWVGRRPAPAPAAARPPRSSRRPSRTSRRTSRRAAALAAQPGGRAVARGRRHRGSAADRLFAAARRGDGRRGRPAPGSRSPTRAATCRPGGATLRPGCRRRARPARSRCGGRRRAWSSCTGAWPASEPFAGVICAAPVPAGPGARFSTARSACRASSDGLGAGGSAEPGAGSPARRRWRPRFSPAVSRTFPRGPTTGSARLVLAVVLAIGLALVLVGADAFAVGLGLAAAFLGAEAFAGAGERVLSAPRPWALATGLLLLPLGLSRLRASEPGRRRTSTRGGLRSLRRSDRRRARHGPAGPRRRAFPSWSAQFLGLVALTALSAASLAIGASARARGPRRGAWTGAAIVADVGAHRRGPAPRLAVAAVYPVPRRRRSPWAPTRPGAGRSPPLPQRGPLGPFRLAAGATLLLVLLAVPLHAHGALAAAYRTAAAIRLARRRAHFRRRRGGGAPRRRARRSASTSPRSCRRRSPRSTSRTSPTGSGARAKSEAPSATLIAFEVFDGGGGCCAAGSRSSRRPTPRSADDQPGVRIERHRVALVRRPRRSRAAASAWGRAVGVGGRLAELGSAASSTRGLPAARRRADAARARAAARPGRSTGPTAPAARRGRSCRPGPSIGSRRTGRAVRVRLRYPRRGALRRGPPADRRVPARRDSRARASCQRLLTRRCCSPPRPRSIRRSAARSSSSARSWRAGSLLRDLWPPRSADVSADASWRSSSCR